MKISLRVCMLLVCLILFALPVLATEESAADNACYEGGSLAGKCDWPTEAENEWAWTCGWYIARAEQGVIAPGEVPSWCGYHPLTAPTVNIITGCIQGRNAGTKDHQFIGPLDTLNNLQKYDSEGGICQTPVSSLTVVYAPDSGAALPICETVLGTSIFATISMSLAYHAPVEWFMCLT